MEDLLKRVEEALIIYKDRKHDYTEKLKLLFIESHHREKEKISYKLEEDICKHILNKKYYLEYIKNSLREKSKSELTQQETGQKWIGVL